MLYGILLVLSDQGFAVDHILRVDFIGINHVLGVDYIGINQYLRLTIVDEICFMAFL